MSDDIFLVHVHYDRPELCLEQMLIDHRARGLVFADLEMTEADPDPDLPVNPTTFERRSSLPSDHRSRFPPED